MTTLTTACSGCGAPVFYNPCLACVRARQRTAVSGGRCLCGRRARPGDVLTHFSRSWVPCLRCLGTIRQLS